MTFDPPISNYSDCYDLVIVGAGAAGLNALGAALGYLGPEDRVALVDRRPGPGGMWNSVYGHVRLHQPYQTFTAADLPWELQRPRGYLARKPEILEHMGHCLDRFRDRVGLSEFFGQELTGWEEVITAEGPRVHVHCVPVGEGGTPRHLVTRRLIQAQGFDVQALSPLTLSSRAVTSTTPEAIEEAVSEAPKAPVVIVGGGKTALDLAQSLGGRSDVGPITMLTGRGTLFADRERILPDGLGRWWRRQLVLGFFGKIARRFDGDNEREVFEYFRKHFAISPDGRGERFVYALLSQGECDAVARAVDKFVPNYLVDVTDTPEGPMMHLRTGPARPIRPGTIFVNCTGHVLHSGKPREPFLSEHGAVITVSPRSAVCFQSTLPAYFLTHLMFLDRLRDLPLYELDLEALYELDAKAFQMASITHTWTNVVQCIACLPLPVLMGCGVDLDRWFPLPRRVAGLVDIKLNQKRYLAHGRAALDRVQARFGIACGPLPAAGRAAPPRAAEAPAA
ncbi:hypothetical protein AB1M95_04850 [Sulfitobacter sp. LCG007]